MKLGLVITCALLVTGLSCKKAISVAEESNSSIRFLSKYDDENIQRVVQVSGGRSLYVGQSSGLAFLLLVDGKGNEIWSYRSQGEGFEGFNGATETSDGNLVVVGYTNSQSRGVVNELTDGWIVKFNIQTGIIIWDQVIGWATADNLFDIKEDPMGNLMVCGYFLNSTADTWVMKLDNMGNYIWAYQYYVGPYHDWGTSMTFSPQGNVIVAGIMSKSNLASETRSFQNYVMEINKITGGIVWKQVLSGFTRSNLVFDQLKWNNDIYTTSEGYIIASTYDNSNPDLYGLIAKLDYYGNIKLTKTYTGLRNCTINNMQILADGSMMIVGSSTAENLVNGVGYPGAYSMIAKTDQNGNILWTKYHGSPELRNCGYCVSQIDGHWHIAGHSLNDKTGRSRMFYYITDNNGEIIE